MTGTSRGNQGVFKRRIVAIPGPVPLQPAAPNGRPCDDEMDLFFEAEGERGQAKLTREMKAKAICATCPIATREACLETALKAEGTAKTGRYGVFAGLNGAERAKIARQRRAAVA